MMAIGFPSGPLFVVVTAFAVIALFLYFLQHLRRRSLASFRQAERQRTDAENRFALAFQHNADPMCISEWDGMILDVNQVFCEISGYSRDELVGRNSLALNLWHRPEERQSRVLQLLRQDGRIRNMEMEFRNKAGAIVPTLLSVSLLSFGGKTRLLSIIQDLSVLRAMEEKSRRLEQELAQAKNLEAMGALVGGLAHQFNNILSSIIGYAELALDDVDATSQTAGDLERILEKALEAQRLVEHTLYFSQERPREKHRLDLRLFLEDIARTMRQRVPSSLNVQTRSAGEPVWIVADPASLQLALLNICGNAVEAMSEGGVLIIGLQYPPGTGERFADVDADLPAGDYAHLFIKDQGTGMDPATLERIFNPFFTTKQPGLGTGMGLSAAYGIVREHGGLIRVNSRKGYGSTFHLFFPVVEEGSSEPSA